MGQELVNNRWIQVERLMSDVGEKVGDGNQGDKWNLMLKFTGRESRIRGLDCIVLTFMKHFYVFMMGEINCFGMIDLVPHFVQQYGFNFLPILQLRPGYFKLAANQCDKCWQSS